jgi:hypothetical protein
LRPWEQAPCQANPHSSEPAGRLLAKMLACGFSKYHPDPTEVLSIPLPETVGGP